MTPELIGAAVAGVVIVVGAVAKVAFSRGQQAASSPEACMARATADSMRAEHQQTQSRVESEHAETREVLIAVMRGMDQRHATTMTELTRLEQEQNRVIGGVLEQVRIIAQDAQAAARETRVAADELRRVAGRFSS